MMSLDASSCSLASKMRPLAYDADGNLLAHDGWSYTYDGWNLLHERRERWRNGVTRYAYDWRHRRVRVSDTGHWF